MMASASLKIIGPEAGTLSDFRQHAWSDFVALMEGERGVDEPGRDSVRWEPSAA